MPVASQTPKKRVHTCVGVRSVVLPRAESVGCVNAECGSAWEYVQWLTPALYGTRLERHDKI
jgi:hypothetical protein